MLQALICLVDKKTGEKSKTRPRFVKQDQVAIMRIECSGLICLEQFKLFPQMGRFTLRDESEYNYNHVILLWIYLVFKILKSKFELEMYRAKFIQVCQSVQSTIGSEC